MGVTERWARALPKKKKKCRFKDLGTIEKKKKTMKKDMVKRPVFTNRGGKELAGEMGEMYRLISLEKYLDK